MDSNAIRDTGFSSVLKDFPSEQVDRLLVYHKKNGGLSRYVKFRYFFEEIRGEQISETEVGNWAALFSEIMLAALLDENLLIKETNDYVQLNYQEKVMHIVSGSDQNELRTICRALGIADFFRSIHGSPTPKKQLVADLLSKHQYPLEDCLLIGDSINDFEAAAANGIDFMAYNNESITSQTSCSINLQ